MTVEQVKKDGFKVDIEHYRNLDGGLVRASILNKEKHKDFSCRGGVTIVELSKGNKSVRAIASCRDQENFNRKLGVRIALGRALKDFSK